MFDSSVKGQTPKVGDRVLVEAQYNPNMPFKWNATSVKVLNYQVNTVPKLNSFDIESIKI